MLTAAVALVAILLLGSMALFIVLVLGFRAKSPWALDPVIRAAELLSAASLVDWTKSGPL